MLNLPNVGRIESKAWPHSDNFGWREVTAAAGHAGDEDELVGTGQPGDVVVPALDSCVKGPGGAAGRPDDTRGLCVPVPPAADDDASWCEVYRREAAMQGGQGCLTCRVGSSLFRQFRAAADVARGGTPHLNTLPIQSSPAPCDNQATCTQ